MFKIYQMEKNIQDYGMLAKNMELVNRSGLMVEYIKVNFKIINKMGKVFILGLMAKNTKANGRMASEMDLANGQSPTGAGGEESL